MGNIIIIIFTIIALMLHCQSLFYHDQGQRHLQNTVVIAKLSAVTFKLKINNFICHQPILNNMTESFCLLFSRKDRQ